MLDTTKMLLAPFLLLAIDIPWLWTTGTGPKGSLSMFEKIQGTPVSFLMWPAAIVYIALAYLLLQQTSVQGAFLNGAAVYAVYDFTNLSIFKNYTIQFAVTDTLWGGTLFAIAHYILNVKWPSPM
jgi:uncharacterized membrane protein